MSYRSVYALRTDRRYVLLSEAAALTGGLISQGVLRDMVHAGKVAGAIRIGHRFFVPKRSLDDLIVDVASGLPAHRNGTSANGVAAH